MYQLLFSTLARFIGFIHWIIVIMNFAAIPCLMVYTEWYIWMPMLTVLVSPFLGSSYCLFSRIENIMRIKACMPLTDDKMNTLVKLVKKIMRIK